MTSSLPITPNTRSEAEAALSHNSLLQTSAAAEAPSSSSPSQATPASSSPSSHPALGSSSFDPSLGSRPLLQTRSSTNYIAAVSASVQKDASASAHNDMLKEQILPPRPKAADAGALAAGEGDGAGGVNERGYVGAENVRGSLGRQQSFAKEDLKRLMQERLLAQREEDEKGGAAAERLQGYSGQGGGAAGY
ncbi:hypothetical protein LTS18_005872 [Coniosporium uncinatum]|uniref:Uncharacterized protein n=1 Tax=Coniosporium uncinatum TaxID=93489 RepID=A0ACC3DQX8_9PEZI|nr:hypothetical protein LTS18_005872 [Coniosporium uncinatum]